MSSKYISVPQELYLTHESKRSYILPVYCALKRLSIDDQPLQYISCAQIEFLLTYTNDNGKNFLSYIKNAVQTLADKDYIEIVERIANHFIINFNKLYNIPATKDYYCNVLFSEVQTIMFSDYFEKSEILRYFLLLTSTFKNYSSNLIVDDNNKPIEGIKVLSELPVSYLAKCLNVSVNTIISYNKILTQLELINIEKSVGTSLYLNNKSCNIYCRPKDIAYAKAYIAEKYGEGELMQLSSDVRNNARSISQKYNRLLSGHSYPQEEIQQIYDGIVKLNAKYQALYDKTHYKMYLDKIKLLDIFDQFDFISSNSAGTPPIDSHTEYNTETTEEDNS